jgi:acetyltransferase
VIDYSKELSLGFSKFVSMGNKTCVDEVALLTYLSEDPKTNAIFLYVEDIRNASSFIQTAYKITHGTNPKPIVILKGGRTDAGAKASISHTGALGGNDLYYDALARQSGCIRVRTIAEFFNLALVISHNPLPAGSNIAIVTNAGGPGILMTDEAVEQGLKMTINPHDLLGDAKADDYKKAVEAIASDATIDSTLVLLTPQSGTEITETAKAIISVPRTKPLIATFMGKETVLPGVQVLRNAGVAVTEYPEEAAAALGQLTKFALESTAVSEAFLLPAVSGSQQLLESPTALLTAFGFPTLETLVARSPEETTAAVQKIGKPCAIKINSRDISHKTDVGGVLLNITAEGAGGAFNTIIASVREKAPTAIITGVTVVEMAPPGGTEFILGFTRKENFGTVVMVGMGGIYVEIMKDVAFSVAPLTKSDAIQMITKLKLSPMLKGFRGSPPLDADALIDALGKLSQLALDMPQIAELDINPIMIYPQGKGARVVDIRLRLYPHA